MSRLKHSPIFWRIPLQVQDFRKMVVEPSPKNVPLVNPPRIRSGTPGLAFAPPVFIS
jgi:hypothetical protein